MIKFIKNLDLKKLISIVFFIFFATPILSPSIFGMTVYIHWFIPLFDISFIRYVLSRKLSKVQWVIIFVSILVSLLLLEIKFIIEMAFLVESLLYIVYCYKMNLLKYIFIGININIFIAFIQFVLYYLDPQLAYYLGPTNIASLIWGEHATATFTNMFTQLGIVKVSGWSREHGFFNALMIISFILYHYVDFNNKNKYQYLAILFGFIMSISKNSILIILILLLIPLKRYVNKIPFVLSVFSVLIVGMITSSILIKNDMYNPVVTTNYESYTHRFSGYTVITELKPYYFIKGVKSIDELPSYVWEKSPYLEYINRFGEFCGLPALLIHRGIVIFIVYLFFMYFFLGFKSFGFFSISLITLTTTYITLTSFVIIGYFVILYLDNDKKIPDYLIESV